MKKLILSTIALFGLLVFNSCEDSVGPNVSTDMESSPVLTSHEGGESFELSEENANEVLLNLAWEAPDFGFPAAITYFVEMDPEGTNFEDPSTLIETNQSSVSMTVGEVNSRLIAAGVPSGVESEINMRIRAHINDDVEDRISETFVLAFTPYTVEIDFPKIYVPGGYQSASGYTADWSPADAPPLTSVEEDDRYEGYVYFANDGSEYKFTAERNWDDGDWGGSAGSLEPGGSNLVIDQAGYYKINVDLNDLTFTTLRTQWGMIGAATPVGWEPAGDDVQMDYNPAEKVWTVTTDLTAGEFKFRANNTWNDIDYGDDGGNGTLDQGGANISVEEAGNYTVTLDLSTVPYSYTLEAN
ncbi:SusE domain-containing protein [Rhodohalobacter sp. 8-1]|uniref:SusE domain-containing protein n=1 Tax=Rhodohalobacter sp. 8-1 TaxID=3131972 RepID=UPI0030EE86DA